MGEVIGQSHIAGPTSNQYTYFQFHVNQTNFSQDVAKRMFGRLKTHPKFCKKKKKKKKKKRQI